MLAMLICPPANQAAGSLGLKGGSGINPPNSQAGFFFFLGPHLWHMEVPRLLLNQSCSCLRTYATATATQDPSRIYDLCRSLQQHWILNPLNEVRDRTHILVNTSWILNPLSHNGNSPGSTEGLPSVSPAECEVSQNSSVISESLHTP